MIIKRLLSNVSSFQVWPDLSQDVWIEDTPTTDHFDVLVVEGYFDIYEKHLTNHIKKGKPKFVILATETDSVIVDVTLRELGYIVTFDRKRGYDFLFAERIDSQTSEHSPVRIKSNQLFETYKEIVNLEN